MITYEIRSVGDFLKVPENRRSDCLVEFLEWIDLAEEATALTEACGVKSTPYRFDWIDDGKTEKTVIFETSPQKPTEGGE